MLNDPSAMITQQERGPAQIAARRSCRPRFEWKQASSVGPGSNSSSLDLDLDSGGVELDPNACAADVSAGDIDVGVWAVADGLALDRKS